MALEFFASAAVFVIGYIVKISTWYNIEPFIT